jgi:hypothetical protein
MIQVAYDFDPRGYFYESSNNFFLNKTGGYLHIRPNFGTPPVGISPNQISDTQLTLYPNPTQGILTIDNGESMSFN